MRGSATQWCAQMDGKQGEAATLEHGRVRTGCGCPKPSRVPLLGLGLPPKRPNCPLSTSQSQHLTHPISWAACPIPIYPHSFPNTGTSPRPSLSLLAATLPAYQHRYENQGCPLHLELAHLLLVLYLRDPFESARIALIRYLSIHSSRQYHLRHQPPPTVQHDATSHVRLSRSNPCEIIDRKACNNQFGRNVDHTIRPIIASTISRSPDLGRVAASNSTLRDRACSIAARVGITVITQRVPIGPNSCASRLAGRRSGATDHTYTNGIRCPRALL